MHKLLLKKIRLEIGCGQSILHLSDKQNIITEMLSPANMLVRNNEFNIYPNKSFGYIIADLDLAALDELDSFLDKASKLIIRPGKLIIIATNLCLSSNLFSFIFNNAPANFKRPLRSLPPIYLRNKVLEHGYYIKNRFWFYDDLLLLFADLPI